MSLLTLTYLNAFHKLSEMNKKKQNHKYQRVDGKEIHFLAKELLQDKVFEFLFIIVSNNINPSLFG